MVVWVRARDALTRFGKGTTDCLHCSCAMKRAQGRMTCTRPRHGELRLVGVAARSKVARWSRALQLILHMDSSYTVHSYVHSTSTLLARDDILSQGRRLALSTSAQWKNTTTTKLTRQSSSLFRPCNNLSII